MDGKHKAKGKRQKVKGRNPKPETRNLLYYHFRISLVGFGIFSFQQVYIKLSKTVVEI